MSWSTIYEFALSGDQAVLDTVKNFLSGFPKNEEGNGVHLYDVRKALYGSRMQRESERLVCSGPGYVYEPFTADDGSLRFTVEVFKNYLEWRKFVRALRRRCGRFRSAVLIDDTELMQDAVPYTSDRTGRLFPHFTLLEGTPEELERFPVIYTDTVKRTEAATSGALLTELRKRGHHFRSFKDFIFKHPGLVIRNAKGETLIGVWGLSSPGQAVPNPYFSEGEEPQEGHPSVEPTEDVR